MIRTDFSSFTQQLWLHVNFSLIRKKWVKSCKDLPSHLSKERVSPGQTLISCLNNACDDECLSWDIKANGACARDMKHLFAYWFMLTSRPSVPGGRWPPGSWSLSIRAPDRYLRSCFSSLDFKGNCLRNKSSLKDFEVQGTSNLLKVKTKEKNQNQQVSCTLGRREGVSQSSDTW